MLYPPEMRVLDAAREQVRALHGDPNHTVAAAAMDTTGRIHTAVNDYHFTGGPCAELVVLGVAAATASGPLVTIVAVGDGDRDVITPCGRCRQVLLDQHPDCDVIIRDGDELRLVNVRSLLPHSYRHPDASPERFVRFSARYFEAVRDGVKTATTRLNDPCAPGPAWLLFEFDDEYRRLPGRVDSVVSKRFDEISDDDARLEGCEHADELRAGLREHYPGVTDADTVEVVRFHTTGVTE